MGVVLCCVVLHSTVSYVCCVVLYCFVFGCNGCVMSGCVVLLYFAVVLHDFILYCGAASSCVVLYYVVLCCIMLLPLSHAAPSQPS